ncbi:MAG: c-type cytochrome [Legionella sp.]|jgi:cytochrome c5
MKMCLWVFLLAYSCAVCANNAGQDTYEHFCISCHQDGVAGAPKFHDKIDWDARLAGKTLDDLLASAMNGVNAMPAQGTCSECSEDDIRAAITYMMPKS